MEFRRHTLDNGLEIVAECNPQAYSMALGFFVNTGSRDETHRIHGVSHFLEHMMFKGTDRRSAIDVNRELDEIGSHSNAYTSEEQTVYYAAFLPEYQDQAIDILSDIMRPALRDSDFQMEKQVILEEIAKYEDQPPFGAHEKCMADHFGDHPLGRNVLGTRASVSALSRDQMLEYFRNRYSPGNICLVAAGNVDFERLTRQAEQHCGDWEPQTTTRDKPLAHPSLQRRSLTVPQAYQEYVIQLSNGPSVEDDQRYASRLLATILGDDSGSRLFWELIDTGLAECAAMGTDEYQGAGTITTYLCCAPHDTAANLERVSAVFAEAQDNGVTEEELERAKSKIRSHLVLQSERPASRLFVVGNHWINRRQYRTLREVIDSYDRVTCDDVAVVLAQYPLDKRTILAVGPLTELP